MARLPTSKANRRFPMAKIAQGLHTNPPGEIASQIRTRGLNKAKALELLADLPPEKRRAVLNRL